MNTAWQRSPFNPDRLRAVASFQNARLFLHQVIQIILSEWVKNKLIINLNYLLINSLSEVRVFKIYSIFIKHLINAHKLERFAVRLNNCSLHSVHFHCSHFGSIVPFKFRELLLCTYIIINKNSNKPITIEKIFEFFFQKLPLQVKFAHLAWCVHNVKIYKRCR